MDCGRITRGEDILARHGVRGGKAMIATLCWRLPPGHSLFPEVLARLLQNR